MKGHPPYIVKAKGAAAGDDLVVVGRPSVSRLNYLPQAVIADSLGQPIRFNSRKERNARRLCHESRIIVIVWWGCAS